MEELTHTECDLCKERKHATLLYHNGTPVLAVCHDCDPKLYDRVKNAVLERLNGYLNAHAEAVKPAKKPAKKRVKRAYDDGWRRERAMEAGMGLGVDAYNDAMGY